MVKGFVLLPLNGAADDTLVVYDVFFKEHIAQANLSENFLVVLTLGVYVNLCSWQVPSAVVNGDIEAGKFKSLGVEIWSAPGLEDDCWPKFT